MGNEGCVSLLYFTSTGLLHDIQWKLTGNGLRSPAAPDRSTLASRAIIVRDFCTSAMRFSVERKTNSILGLQSFPRESKDKDIAAMLEDITKEANEKSFVNVLQHGGDDVTCKRRIRNTK
jgi:hypothetical protein